jgi:hypothetical protein
MAGDVPVICDTADEALALVDRLTGAFVPGPESPLTDQPGSDVPAAPAAATMETTRRYGCQGCGATREVTAIPSHHSKVVLCQACNAECRQMHLAG